MPGPAIPCTREAGRPLPSYTPATNRKLTPGPHSVALSSQRQANRHLARAKKGRSPSSPPQRDPRKACVSTAGGPPPEAPSPATGSPAEAGLRALAAPLAAEADISAKTR